MLAPRASRMAALEGETARVVAPALAALNDVFESRGKLTEVLDRAKQVRASMSGIAFWGNDDKEREVFALLQGPSIELPPEATPLARRALLDRGARDVRVVPEQLLSAMAAAYERARDAVVAVQQAWERIEPVLAQAERSSGTAKSTAVVLQVEAAVQGELAAVAQELEAARVLVARDPLGATADVAARLSPRASAISQQLAGLAAQRDRVTSGLTRAQSTLVQLREAHAAARSAVDALPRGSPARAPPVHRPRRACSRGSSRGSTSWSRWRARDASRRPRSGCRSGTPRRRATSRATRRSPAPSRPSWRVATSSRDGLRARRAQAQALAARGVALDAALEDMAREAEKLLARRPTPLAHAAALVERYEAEMRPGR